MMARGDGRKMINPRTVACAVLVKARMTVSDDWIAGHPALMSHPLVGRN